MEIEMKPVISTKTFAVLLTGIFIVFFTAAVFADESDSNTETPDPITLNKVANPIYLYSLDPESPDFVPGPFWSYGNSKIYKNGDHEITFSNGLSALMDPTPYGTAMPSGMFSGSITYRYKGLFGGIVRPGRPIYYWRLPAMASNGR